MPNASFLHILEFFEREKLNILLEPQNLQIPDKIHEQVRKISQTSTENFRLTPFDFPNSLPEMQMKYFVIQIKWRNFWGLLLKISNPNIALGESLPSFIRQNFCHGNAGGNFRHSCIFALVYFCNISSAASKSILSLTSSEDKGHYRIVDISSEEFLIFRTQSVFYFNKREYCREFSRFLRPH